MCRSIKTLRREPDVTDEDITGAPLQYVRKLSGYHAPSQKNKQVFDRAVADIAHVTKHLLEDLQTA